jgi:hypothetical protein
MRPPARPMTGTFGDPRRASAGDLTSFLEEADRLPGIRTQLAMRRAIALRPGANVRWLEGELTALALPTPPSTRSVPSAS